MLKNRSINLGLLSALLLSAFAAGVSSAADHRDSPGLSMTLPASPDIRSLDINDVYLFRSPTNPNNTVMMMTVNPLIAPGETGGVFFSSLGSYEFKISHGDNSDVATDITFSCKFTAPRAGRQEIRVTQINHATNRSELIARGQTGSNIAIRGGGQLQANVFDDPFFFDLHAFKADGTPPREFNDANKNDFFLGLNVSIIVLEVPSTILTTLPGGGTDPVFTLWCRTLRDNVQIDRMGIPTINTVLIRPNRFIGPLPIPFVPNPRAPTAASFKDQFNLTMPANDVFAWSAEVRMALIALGNTEADAIAVTNLLLPDVLTFDTSKAVGVGFGTSLGGGVLNGRRLQDDVVDIELGLLVKANVPARNGDSISHRPYRDRFPYVLPPNP